MFEKGIGTNDLSMGNGLDVTELAKWKPRWLIKKYDENFELYDEEIIDGNLLLNEGVTELLNLLIDGTATPFNNANAHIGIGDGTTAAVATQTGLVGTNKTYRPMDATYPKVNGQTVIFRSTFGATFGNHAWREFTVANGNSDTAKNLNRLVKAPLRTKVSPDTWVVELQVTIS